MLGQFPKTARTLHRRPRTHGRQYARSLDSPSEQSGTPGSFRVRVVEYRDGSDPKLLDIVDVPLLRQCPEEYQRENWLLDPK